MKRCWLHIGMHKTGTTSVQHNLRRIGNTDDWRYVCVGAKLHMNIPFFAMFATNPLSYKWFDTLGISLEEAHKKGEMLRSRFAEAIRSAPEETIVMSAEALPLVDGAGIRRLREFLDPFFDEIMVIGYVRPPVSFKVSIYQELVKQGRKLFDPFNIRVSYRKKFEKFDKVFGSENVLLVKFAPSEFAGSCIVSDFCEKTGIEFPEDSPVERANDGMCREACGILYSFYKFGSGYGSGKRVIVENSWIIKPLQEMSGSKLAIRTSLFCDALAKEGEDIAWMETRLGRDLSEKFSDNESVVSSESDLLNVRRESLVKFVVKFEQYHQIKAPREMMHRGENLDPRAVADFVGLCKDLVSARNRSMKGSGGQKSLVSRKKGADGRPAPASMKRRAARTYRAVERGVSDFLARLRWMIGAGCYKVGCRIRAEKSGSSGRVRGVDDAREIVADCEKAVYYNKNDPAGFIRLGVCHLRTEDWSEARKAFASAICLRPNEKKWYRYYRHAVAKERSSVNLSPCPPPVG